MKNGSMIMPVGKEAINEHKVTCAQRGLTRPQNKLRI
jgi:hypothetical protein